MAGAGGAVPACRGRPGSPADPPARPVPIAAAALRPLATGCYAGVVEDSRHSTQEAKDVATGLGKGDVAAHVATKLKGTRNDGTLALNAVLDSITEALQAGKSVTLTGFGTFEVRRIKARKVRAIRGGQAGQLVTVPAHRRPGFRAGRELQRAVAGRR